MGMLEIIIEIGDPAGTTFEELQVIVDTGSTNTVVPRQIPERLGVPVTDTKPTRIADGSLITSRIGDTIIRLEGQTFPTPVTFAEPGEPAVLGVIALERAALAVDPLEQRLVPTNLMRL
ncbi:MAG: aspartyl protease family protein [Chloroflexota bacterium]|nr:aspartyl protease family protein [Chloroflexota bacterium]